MRNIRRGDEGGAVRDVQHRLSELGHRIEPVELEGLFGASTESAVRAFQLARRLPADGVVGADTWNQLVEAGYRLGDRTLYLRLPAFRGDDVRALQQMLNALGFDAGKADGIFGRRAADAVMEFQRNLGDRVDGIVGLDTVRSLERMRPAVGGPGFAVVREEESIRSMMAPLEASIVAVDAGDEPGASGPGGWPGTDLTLELATELATALEIRGATPVLLRRSAEDPAPSDRARTANAVEAAVCVSLRLADAGEGGGAACAYWGTATTHSPAGRRLAELVQGALVEVGLRDRGIRPLGIALLRETRMPAVQVEPGRLSVAEDRRRLEDGGFRRELVTALAESIGRFLAGTTA